MTSLPWWFFLIPLAILVLIVAMPAISRWLYRGDSDDDAG